MSYSRQTACEILNRDINIVSSLLLAYLIQKRRRSARRFGVNPVNSKRKRQGYYNNLVAEMRLNDTETFVNFHRMSLTAFDELLALVGTSIQHINVGERSISASQRLSLTLRYLASGDRYVYRIGQNITSKIISETCLQLWEVLKNLVFPTPSNIKWKEIACDFEHKWHFPHCVGAMDGKHVIVQAFGNSESTYFNYEHSHSVVLFAISDANYKFIMVDIGAPGHVGDSSIFRRSEFGRAVIRGDDLSLPPPENLRDGKEYPYVFVGDETFPLLPNLMRPYPGGNTSVLPATKIAYNCRLSKARKVVEIAFGILTSRWGIYRKPIIASKLTVMAIIKATVVLHNWLREKNSGKYVSADLDDSLVDETNRPGTWRNEDNSGMRQIQRVSSNNPSRNAVEIRDQFQSYFNEVDVLPWQNNSNE